MENAIDHEAIDKQITDARRSFANGFYTAMCDKCGKQAKDKRAALINDNWFLAGYENFCPDCN